MNLAEKLIRQKFPNLFKEMSDADWIDAEQSLRGFLSELDKEHVIRKGTERLLDRMKVQDVFSNLEEHDPHSRNFIEIAKGLARELSRHCSGGIAEVPIVYTSNGSPSAVTQFVPIDQSFAIGVDYTFQSLFRSIMYPLVALPYDLPQMSDGKILPSEEGKYLQKKYNEFLLSVSQTIISSSNPRGQGFVPQMYDSFQSGLAKSHEKSENIAVVELYNCAVNEFVIAHEFAHIELGHFNLSNENASSDSSRAMPKQRELDADRLAFERIVELPVDHYPEYFRDHEIVNVARRFAPLLYFQIWHLVAMQKDSILQNHPEPLLRMKYLRDGVEELGDEAVEKLFSAELEDLERADIVKRNVIALHHIMDLILQGAIIRYQFIG